MKMIAGAILAAAAAIVFGAGLIADALNSLRDQDMAIGAMMAGMLSGIVALYVFARGYRDTWLVAREQRATGLNRIGPG